MRAHTKRVHTRAHTDTVDDIVASAYQRETHVNYIGNHRAYAPLYEETDYKIRTTPNEHVFRRIP